MSYVGKFANLLLVRCIGEGVGVGVGVGVAMRN